ncbi:MAG: phosphoglucomutase/phosphomannomutase family protein [Armatimonadota bacterium]
MKPIKFGTDGWRGIIADDFTFQRVAVACAAIGEYLQADEMAEQGVAIGYDNRFASEAFAQLASVMLTQQGIRVYLSGSSLPTPMLSYAIRHRELGGGIMVTASHNPAQYNGIKFKPWFAGSAFEDSTVAIEQRTNRLLDTLDVDAIRGKGLVDALFSREDFFPPYAEHVLNYVTTDPIRDMRPRLLFDPLYGSSQGVLDRVLRDAGCDVRMIHNDRNPGFAGLHPEPVPEQLQGLIQAVGQTRVDGAIASDGDGDRLSAVAEDGTYVSPHHVFALLLIHMVEDRGLRGGVVKTVSTTTMIDQLAKRYDLPLYETPIGFKYICRMMLDEEKDILMGGEESGGIGFRGHIPERDATLAALLLAEMMGTHHATLGELLGLLRERVGAHYYDRVDVLLGRPATREQFGTLRSILPSRMAGAAVADVSERDGLKVFLEDGSWLLLRASGTEPVLRVYAESDSPDKVQELLDQGYALVGASGLPKAA